MPKIQKRCPLFTPTETYLRYRLLHNRGLGLRPPNVAIPYRLIWDWFYQNTVEHSRGQRHLMATRALTYPVGCYLTILHCVITKIIIIVDLLLFPFLGLALSEYRLYYNSIISDLVLVVLCGWTAAAPVASLVGGHDRRRRSPRRRRRSDDGGPTETNVSVETALCIDQLSILKTHVHVS